MKQKVIHWTMKILAGAIPAVLVAEVIVWLGP
jgi:hypothetical protein